MPACVERACVDVDGVEGPGGAVCRCCMKVLDVAVMASVGWVVSVLSVIAVVGEQEPVTPPRNHVHRGVCGKRVRGCPEALLWNVSFST